jgi:DNA polymerase, archaea type
MDNKEEWIGSATALLSSMETVAATLKVNTKSRMWPKGPNILIRKLNEVKATLEDVGISITRGLDTQSKVKTVEIHKKALLPLPSLQGEKCAQITSGSGNDIGNDTLPPTEISLLKEEQKHAQIGECNASNDSNDTLRGYESYNKNIFPNRYLVFDFEWSQESSFTLIAAAFVDSDGNTKALHTSEYSSFANPEAEFIKMINQELLKYDFSMGWYSTGIARYHEDTQEYLDGVDSDLAVLHNRCVANDVDSLVEFNSAGRPYIRGQTHIDLYDVFSKPMVQTTIFKNAYRTLRLDEVSKAILTDTGHEDPRTGVVGKYKGLAGKDIQSLPVEEQKKYVLRDAELVMRLSKHNNSNVLDAMKSISEITGLDFEKVCRTGLSTWWAAIFDDMGVASFYRTKDKLEQQYVGGLVLQPKKGLYHNLIIADVTSLYPTMAILYNISFDTVNCECCKDDLQCRITEDITKDCRMQNVYWICRQKEGAFPKKLKIFKEERLRQKNLGNQVKQLALKILINGGYGVFGSQYFKYYDPRVAELIAAYGKYTISKMKDIAHNIGFEIVYGDTDSLFLHYVDNSNAVEVISKFKEECNKQLGVEVEHAKTYQTAIISDKKKHYIGWTGIEGREPDIVGMEGEKNDRPRWINIVFRQIAHDILVSSNPIDSLKKAVVDLELGNVNPELLKRSTRLSKNPDEYENENDRKRKIGLAIGARKGDVIEYFETDKNREGHSLNPQGISIKKYKIMLWKVIKDILEIAGYDIATVERELFEPDTIGHMAMPSRGVAGITSYTSLVPEANQVAKYNIERGGDF